MKKSEMLTIRWHMAFSEEKSTYNSVGKAMEKYPLVLALHEADMEASKLFEDISGNKYFAEMVTQLVRVQKREESEFLRGIVFKEVIVHLWHQVIDSFIRKTNTASKERKRKILEI